MINLFPYHYRFNLQTCQLDDSIWFFGCSNVYGHELHDYQTAPAVLEKMIGMPVINLGISGGNIFNIQHNLSELITSHHPAAVVIAWPRPTRWVDQDGFNWGPWMLSPGYDTSALNQKWLTEYKKLIETDDITRLTNDAILNIRDIINTLPSVEFTYTSCRMRKPVRTHEIQLIDFAPDKGHPGPNTNIKVAEWVYKQLVVLDVTK